MSYIHINCLSLEILTQIFEYLPLSDRKCVRLTCSRFYDACNQISILKSEKLTINWDYKDGFSNQYFNSIINTCLKSNCKYLNLKLKNAEPIQSMDLFWEKCGPKIHYLYFKNCVIYQTEIKNLIIHCSSLEHLSFQKCELHITPNLFQDLLSSHIYRESLSSFEIVSSSFESWNMSHYIFNRICVIYPKIRSITLTNVDIDFEANEIKHNPSLRITKETFIDSKNVFTFHCIFNKIISAAEVFEEINLSDIVGFTDTWLLNLAEVPNLKLKKICFKKNPGITSSAFIKFCTKQLYLEYIYVCNCKWFNTECLQHLLEVCRNLKILKIYLIHIILTYDSIKMLVLSNLKVLVINSWLKIDLEDINSKTNANQLVNYKLRYLSFEDSLKESENLFILRTFRGLTYYDSEYISYKMTDVILQSICKYQKNMKHLKINGNISDYGFSGTKTNEIYNVLSRSAINNGPINSDYIFSLRRLKNLQKLELWNCRKITNNAIMELIFPNLRHLSLKHCKKISDDGYISICVNNPYLEMIYFENMTISFETIMIFVRRMKRLQELSIVKCVSLSEVKLQIILLCSHLFFRYLIYNFGYEHIEYHYDLPKKKWKKMIDETSL